MMINRWILGAHNTGQTHMSIDQFHRSTSSNIHCNLRWTRWTWDGAGHSHLAHAACTRTPQSGFASWRSEMDGKCFLGPKAIDIFPWYWNIMKISTYNYVSFIIIYICVYVCRCFCIGYHNLFTSHGGVRLYIAGGSNCSLANLLSPKQLVWVNAILAGYQCLTSPVYQFITQTQSKQQGIEICIVLELGTTNRWRHQWICSFKTWGEPGVDCCTLR